MADAVALVWIRGPGLGCKAVRCPSTLCPVLDFIHRHCQDQDIPVECFFVKCNGSLINTHDTVQHGAVYNLEPRLRGGKGGFGSMLRALGAQIEKTTNREACRDLSGRRLRDVNHEKAMAEWVKQQAEREAEKEQKRLERLQRKLAEPRHCFTSPDYQQQCHEMAERLEDSVLKGMQAASSKMVLAEIGEKRKQPNKSKTYRGASARKRKCFWLDMQGLETAEGSSSESSDDDSEEAPSTSGMSFHVPKHGSDGVETVAEFPSGSQRTSVLSMDSRSPEKLQTTVSDSGNGAVEDMCMEQRETSAQEDMEMKMTKGTEETQERKGTESKEPVEKEVGSALTKEKETKEMTDGERAAKLAPGADRKTIPTAKLEESWSGNTLLSGKTHLIIRSTDDGVKLAFHSKKIQDIGWGTVDLLAFNSAAEMESLGLERLKGELLALGLKCGGTLQERAARLFSVRGLTKEQMDPALFAKPLKGKKK